MIRNVLIVLALVLPVSLSQQVTLNRPGGAVTASIVMPAGAKRAPAVCVLSSADVTGLMSALAEEGVAALRLDPATDIDTAAQWIAFLRNDERFPTVTMFGDGASMLTAVVAARAARADGVFVRGDTAAAGPELKRVIAKVGDVRAGGVDREDAKQIAAFARTVPALGRRGTAAVRPAGARRSPRQVTIASVGSVRVAIEWGSPQKRGREVWGQLVKLNEEWMPGADEATSITTDGPIRIGPLEVPAGDHTIFAMPAADRFELIISKDVGQFHTQHDASKHLGRVEMTLSTRTDSVEGLTFAIENGLLKLIWDTREYSVAINAFKK